MKIRGSELYVMMDALLGSLKVCDRTDSPLWNFSRSTREGILNDIIDRMGKEDLDVTGFASPPKTKEN